MLGVQTLLIVAMCFVVGLEYGSPGTVMAVLRAGAMVYVTLHEHTLPQLCQSLNAVGAVSTGCPAI